MPRATEVTAYVAGVIAAEGCFLATDNARRFALAIGLGATDTITCELVAAVLGVGRITTSPRRKAHFDDEVTWKVQSLPDLVGVVVPFLDEHLAPSYKRAQYTAWRARLLHYWSHDAKRVRPCSADGCDRPRRAKGLCRRHYYAAYGQ